MYCFAKRLHTSSRGQGKSLMSHSKSKRRTMYHSLFIMCLSLGETLTELMLNIKKKWTETRELFQQDKLDKVIIKKSLKISFFFLSLS